MLRFDCAIPTPTKSLRLISHLAPTANPRDGFQLAELCPSAYLLVYLSYICCVCRKHIFGHVLRIDASLNYVIDDFTTSVVPFFFSFSLSLILRFFYHTCACLVSLSTLISFFFVFLRYTAFILLLLRTGLAFFKIYFGPVFSLCVLEPAGGG